MSERCPTCGQTLTDTGGAETARVASVSLRRGRLRELLLTGAIAVLAFSLYLAWVFERF